MEKDATIELFARSKAACKSDGKVRSAKMKKEKDKDEPNQDWIEASAAAPLRAVDDDFRDIPDAAMTVAAAVLFADAPSIGADCWISEENIGCAAFAGGEEFERCGAFEIANAAGD